MADSIVRLKLNSDEYDSKIKRAVSGLMQMEAECRKVGGTLAILEKDQLDYVKSLGSMETVSRTARGRISELSNAYVELAVQYRRLTDEEKKGDYGKALNSSLTQLKGRLNDAKKELAEVEGEMKGASAAGVDFNSVLASLGQRFGINSELMGVLTSGTVATTAAVTAGAAAVAAATKMWADYNDELNRQTNVTTVTTGLKGDDAENLTIGVRALAKTYDVDFREAINAANTLIQQFGVSGEQALSLLQDGMQGMIAGDGGKLLSMIQQYAPAFRDAGISASQLVAVIQNSEGGLFTDENMQAISMGIRNIRLMTSQTSNALAQLGIDGQEMSRKLEDGSMTIFDALRQVSGAIENVDSGSKAAGEVMQSVFGRSGFQAGTKLGEAIATLNTNLEETKTQTGELGESFVRLNDANVRLENTMKEVFGMTGWEDMNNLIKTDLANTLSDVIGFLGDIKTSITEIGTADGFNALCDVLDSLVIPKLMGVTTMMKNIKAFMDGLKGGGSGLSEGNGQIGGGVGGLIPAAKPKPQHTYTETVDESGRLVKATRDGNDVTEEVKKIKHPSPSTTTIQTTNTTPKVGGSKKETWAPIEMQAVGGLSFGRSIKDVQADLSRAQGAYNIAEDENSRAAAKKMVEAYQRELEAMKNEGDVTEEVKKIKHPSPSTTTIQTTNTTPKVGGSKKETWAPIEKQSVGGLSFGRSIKDVQADLSRAQGAYNIAEDENSRAAAKKMVEAYQRELEAMKNEGDVTKGLMKDAYTHDFGKDMDRMREDADRTMKGEDSISLKETIGKVNEKIGALSQIAGGLQQMGLKLPEGMNELIGVMQGAMQVVQGVQTFLEVGQSVALTANTTAVGLNTAAMVAMTAALQVNTASELIPFFRNGGIVPHAATGLMVPGNDFSDSTPVMVSSGELILNKAQQNAVAQGLQEERGRGDYSSTPYVDGEKIYLGMNNFLRRSGRGEIVTSRR